MTEETKPTHFKSDVANVQYGDVGKVAKFEVQSESEDGRSLVATLKPQAKHKFAVLLLGEMHKDDNPLDFDLDEALEALGYIRADSITAINLDK